MRNSLLAIERLSLSFYNKDSFLFRSRDSQSTYTILTWGLLPDQYGNHS